MYLREIEKLNNETQYVYNSVLLQSHSYNKSSLLNNIQKCVEINSKPSYLTSIHPVLIALFVPKFEILDTYILRSNLSQIVIDRYKGNKILYKPNKLLLNWLVYDLTDVTCMLNSPLKDIKERFIIQWWIWD